MTPVQNGGIFTVLLMPPVLGRLLFLLVSHCEKSCHCFLWFRVNNLYWSTVSTSSLLPCTKLSLVLAFKPPVALINILFLEFVYYVFLCHKRWRSLQHLFSMQKGWIFFNIIVKSPHCYACIQTRLFVSKCVWKACFKFLQYFWRYDLRSSSNIFGHNTIVKITSSSTLPLIFFCSDFSLQSLTCTVSPLCWQTLCAVSSCVSNSRLDAVCLFLFGTLKETIAVGRLRSIWSVLLCQIPYYLIIAFNAVSQSGDRCW